MLSVDVDCRQGLIAHVVGAHGIVMVALDGVVELHHGWKSDRRKIFSLRS